MAVLLESTPPAPSSSSLAGPCFPFVNKQVASLSVEPHGSSVWTRQQRTMQISTSVRLVVVPAGDAGSSKHFVHGHVFNVESLSLSLFIPIVILSFNGPPLPTMRRLLHQHVVLRCWSRQGQPEEGQLPHSSAALAPGDESIRGPSFFFPSHIPQQQQPMVGHQMKIKTIAKRKRKKINFINWKSSSPVDLCSGQHVDV